MSLLRNLTLIDTIVHSVKMSGMGEIRSAIKKNSKEAEKKLIRRNTSGMRKTKNVMKWYHITEVSDTQSWFQADKQWFLRMVLGLRRIIDIFNFR